MGRCRNLKNIKRLQRYHAPISGDVRLETMQPRLKTIVLISVSGFGLVKLFNPFLPRVPKRGQ